MEEHKAGEKSPKKKSMTQSDRKESVYTLQKKKKEEEKRH